MEDKRREDVTCSILATRHSNGKFYVELKGMSAEVALCWAISGIHLSNVIGVPVYESARSITALAELISDPEVSQESSETIRMNTKEIRKQMEGGGGE